MSDTVPDPEAATARASLVHFAEDDIPAIEEAERMSPAPPRRMIEVGEEVLDRLFAELHTVRLAVEASNERDSKIENLEIGMLAAHEQLAHLRSGMTALLLRDSPSGTQLQGKRLLLVEDNAQLSPAYVKTLEGYGASVEPRSTYVEALRHLDECDELDVALLDVRLPDGSGIDLAGRIKDEWPRCAIVLTTGFPEEPHKTQARRLGVPLLGKPHVPGELLRTIEGQIARLEAPKPSLEERLDARLPHP